MTDPSFNSYFLKANTVHNVQNTEGILCRNSEYAVLSRTPLNLGNSHNILFILKLSSFPFDVWANIFRLEQNDNVV